MKKVAFIVLVFSTVSFISCKKCQTCTTKTTQDVGFFPITTSVSEEYCGKEYDNAPAETNVTQEVAGVSQTVDISCVDD